MEDIAVGTYPSYNSIAIYNTRTFLYYNTPSYNLDEDRPPSSQLPCHIKYDNGMILGVYLDKRNPTPKPSPPGTRTPILRDRETQSTTVEHIPILPSDRSIPPTDQTYLLKFDNDTTTKLKYKYLSEAMHPSATTFSIILHDNIGLPTLFQDRYKAKKDINGIFKNGYISR